MVSTLRIGLTLALSIVSLVGCARLHLDERLSTLEHEEQARRAKLAELELQISSAEQRALILAVTEALAAAGARSEEGPGDVARGSPRPEPVARIMPSG